MKKDEKSFIYRFLTPAVLMFCLIFVYPMIRTAVMSFFRVDSISGPISEWVFTGLENYSSLFQSKLFLTSLFNIFKIWIIGGVFVISLGLLYAVIINSGIKYKKFFKAVLYLPHIISAVALATMWLQYVFDPRYGFLTNFFEFIGWERMAKIQWLDAGHKFAAMLIAYGFGCVGFHMLIFSGGIEKIPIDLYEASYIDGANKFKQFFKITLPLIAGEVKTNITMWSISVVSFYVWGQLFSTVNADLQTVSPVIYLYLHTFGNEGFAELNAGVGAAVGVLMGILVVIIFAVLNRIFDNKDNYEL